MRPPAPPATPARARPLEEHDTPLLERAGLVVFLGSWSMLFATLLFTAAVIRTRAPVWPPLPLASAPGLLAGGGVAALLAGRLGLAAALRALHRGHLARLRVWGSLSAGLGLTALTLPGVGLAERWGRGLRLDSGGYGGIFYTLSVFQSLHVCAALCFTWGVLPGLLRHPPGATQRARLRRVATLWSYATVTGLLVFLTLDVP